MTTTGFRPTRPTKADDELGLLARQQRRRRMIPTLAVAVFSLAASFVVFLSLEPKPAGRAVLVLRSDAVAGQTLSANDLKVMTVDAPGLMTVPAKDEATILGKALSVSLPAGSLISPALLVGSRGPLQGQAIVGAALKAGAYPPDLTPGAQVQVFAGSASPLGSAMVYTLQAPSDTQSVAVVSLMVPARSAGTISAAAAAGTLTLVWVTP